MPPWLAKSAMGAAQASTRGRRAIEMLTTAATAQSPAAPNLASVYSPVPSRTTPATVATQSSP